MSKPSTIDQYSSTARSLALPISPPRSPDLSQQNLHASWGNRHSGGSFSRASQLRRGRGPNMIEKSINNAERTWRKLYRAAEKLTPAQMALLALLGLLSIVLGVLFLVFSERIFAWLEPVAEKWKNLAGGWLIIWFMTFATAFPPIIGYSTCLTLAGFIYGFPAGWPIVASATVVGSTCSFIVSRTILAGFVNRLVANDRRFEALSLVLKQDGLKLLVMIRLCPLPYSISNGAISTFPTVSPLSFALATAAATPKLFGAIFIGSRLAVIAKSGEKMDTTTKAINWIGIFLGVIIGGVTGWIIYNRTMARSRQIEAEQSLDSRLTTRQNSEFSDDTEENTATATLIRDDQIDFLNRESLGSGYRDELSDSEDNTSLHDDRGGLDRGMDLA